jgi:pimeloyl-ACP methyl ester carboxylesterase
MRFTSETTSDGVSERLFTIGDIPGVLWSPADAADRRPLVLLGHGGGQHKKAPGLVARARRYVTACGFAVAAIDAPGHGDRPRTEQDERLAAEIREHAAAGEPIGPPIARHNAALAARAVPEWQATLDALLDGTGGPAGFWGVSLGSAIGVPLAAAEPRIAAAVFGLAGHETLAKAAAGVTVPVEFLLQWDDELVPREEGLALFDAFASREKTLHANPGRHAGVPAFELESSARFFTRHLRPVGASALSVASGHHVTDVCAVDGERSQDDRKNPDRDPDIAGPVRDGQAVLHDPGGTFPDHRRPRPAGQVPVRILLAGGDRIPGPVHRPADEVQLDRVAGRSVHAVHHQAGQDTDQHGLPRTARQVGAQPVQPARQVRRIVQCAVREPRMP